MKNSWLKKSIFILLLLDAIVGTAFGVHIYLSNDIAFFEKYYLVAFYAALFDIVAPIYLIVKLVVRVCKATKEKKKAIAEEKARLEEERLKEIERQKAIEEEKKRKSLVIEEVNSIINRYKTDKLPNIPLVNEIDVCVDIENVQAVETVKQYKAEQSYDIKRCIKLEKQINKIINEDKEPDEKLKYLKANLTVLDSLKADFDEIYSKISTRKINIAAKTGGKSMLGSLLEEIATSEKCVNVTTSIKDLVTSQEPVEYGFFVCSEEPTILKYDNVSYCVFNNIILAFDCDGIFLTAINPSSLELNLQKHCCFVEIVDGCMKDSKYIGKDSRCLKEGEPTYSWLYMRKDGLPDRRHTYNPCYVCRKDKYEYGRFTFKLLDTTFTYIFSSAAAINYIMELSYKYDAEKYNNVELCKITYEGNRT